MDTLVWDELRHVLPLFCSARSSLLFLDNLSMFLSLGLCSAVICAQKTPSCPSGLPHCYHVIVTSALVDTDPLLLSLLYFALFWSLLNAFMYLLIHLFIHSSSYWEHALQRKSDFVFFANNSNPNTWIMTWFILISQQIFK